MKRKTKMNKPEPTPKVMTPQVLALTLYDIVSDFASFPDVENTQKLSDFETELNTLEADLAYIIQLARKTNGMEKK